MEANELRIGNYVLHDNKPKKVWKIICDDYCCVEGRDTYCEMGTDIEPIPLTEEWLLKFGFEKSNIDKKYYRKSLTPPIYWVYRNTFGMDGLPLNVNFQYVHQLQNLYFALTGEELTTTKNTNK